MIYFIISYILNDTVHISGPICVIFKTFCLIVVNYLFTRNYFFCGFVIINRILFIKNSCTHLQPDNRVLVMPRGLLDILKKVLGMHAQVVTKPSLATSGQLTIHGLKSSDLYIFYSEETHNGFPANTRRRTTVDPMPAHRLRLCANTKSTPAQRPAFAGNTSLYLTCLVYSFIQKYNKIKSFMSKMNKCF